MQAGAIVAVETAVVVDIAVLVNIEPFLAAALRSTEAPGRSCIAGKDCDQTAGRVGALEERQGGGSQEAGSQHSKKRRPEGGGGVEGREVVFASQCECVVLSWLVEGIAAVGRCV